MNHQKDGHFGGRGIGRAETIDRNFPVWRCIKLDFDPSVNVINGRSQVRCLKFLQLSVYFASIIFVRLFRINDFSDSNNFSRISLRGGEKYIWRKCSSR